jgi:hypothetical protein
MVIMASEAGVLPVPESRIVRKWRLQPGKMFLIDLEQGRIIDDKELKDQLSASKPYREWIEKVRIKLESIGDPSADVDGGGATGSAADAASADVPSTAADYGSPASLLDLQQAFRLLVLVAAHALVVWIPLLPRHDRRAVRPDEHRVVDLVERALHRHAAFDELVGRQVRPQRVDQLLQANRGHAVVVRPGVCIVGHRRECTPPLGVRQSDRLVFTSSPL